MSPFLFTSTQRFIRPTAQVILRYRTLHTSYTIRQSSKPNQTKDAQHTQHSADNYFKDVDQTPPQDPTIHRVDAGSESCQRPHEPPSGQWSQAGANTGEYENVSRAEPYDAPLAGSGNRTEVTGGLGKHEKETKLEYGGMERSGRKDGSEMSRSEEGPAEGAKGGRKPEGR